MDTGKADTEMKRQLQMADSIEVSKGQLLNIWMTRPMILAALTQNDTWEDLVIKSNERQMNYPNWLQMMNRGCHVQE